MLRLYDTYFIRNGRAFVKSRWSRTRQWSKSIVFFATFLNAAFFFHLLMFSYKFYIIMTFFLITFNFFYKSKYFKSFRLLYFL